MTAGSLFSGIGGFDLGLERAGFTVRWQVEYEPFCSRVLAKHWPNVTRYGDIKAINWEEVEKVDLICGGFPCQPVSLAGRRKAQEDSRWLWPEFHRCVAAIRPKYVIIENVPGLLSKGFGDVLRGLWEIGYDAEWDCISASAVGANHRRDRVWITAYPADISNPNGKFRGEGREDRRGEQPRHGEGVQESVVPDSEQLGSCGEADDFFGGQLDLAGGSGGSEPEGCGTPRKTGYPGELRSGERPWTGGTEFILGPEGDVSNPGELRCDSGGSEQPLQGLGAHGETQQAVADPDSQFQPESGGTRGRGLELSDGGRQGTAGEGMADPKSPEYRLLGSGIRGKETDALRQFSWWEVEPNVGRVANGVPDRVDRLKALGNAVVPQVVEWIGRQIVRAEEAKARYEHTTGD